MIFTSQTPATEHKWAELQINAELSAGDVQLQYTVKVCKTLHKTQEYFDTCFHLLHCKQEDTQSAMQTFYMFRFLSIIL